MNHGSARSILSYLYPINHRSNFPPCLHCWSISKYPQIVSKLKHSVTLIEPKLQRKSYRKVNSSLAAVTRNIWRFPIYRFGFRSHFHYHISTKSKNRRHRVKKLEEEILKDWLHWLLYRFFHIQIYIKREMTKYILVCVRERESELGRGH